MTLKRHIITFDRSHWKIPNFESAFEGCLEGAPSDCERKEILESVERKRRLWEPSSEAWAQFDLLKPAIGKKVTVQQWDPIMLMLDDEGPHPLSAQCSGLHLSLNDDGKLQAFVSLDKVLCLVTPLGYDGRSKLQKGSIKGEYLMSLGDISSISWEEEPSMPDAFTVKVRMSEGKKVELSPRIKR